MATNQGNQGNQQQGGQGTSQRGFGSMDDQQQRDIASKGIRLHHVRLCYRVTVLGGALRNEPQGSTDLARWVRFGEALDLNPIAPFVTAVIETAEEVGHWSIGVDLR